MLLGRFLEISVHAPDVRESLAFYESLGFVQASTGEAWRHPYAVVTDGRLAIGLHQREMESPVLTWVLPELARQADGFESLGIEFESVRFDSEALNELAFVAPSGQHVRMLEARTFSPPALAPGHSSELGYFEEFGMAADDLAAAGAFWEQLGFVAFELVSEPFSRMSVAGRDINLGLYDLDLRAPVLTFTDEAMNERIARLRGKGHAFAARLPRGMPADGGALLRAPEGTQLLLLPEK